MSGINVEPRLTVQLAEVEDDARPDEGDWDDYRTYHIAAPEDAGSNNRYVGEQIQCMLNCIGDSPDLWWRIVYEEIRTISTTNGTMSLGRHRSPVTDECKEGVHVEEFNDRNSDGYYELNRGMPIYEQYPRFWTEHDYPAEVAGGEDPEALRIGDHVRVSDDPRTAEGGAVATMFFGAVGRLTGKDGRGHNWIVTLPDGNVNYIGEEYLTKVNADGSPIEEKKGDEEFKAGDEVEGEDEPDDTIHVSDGDVITVYDEFGHEKTMRISVV